MLSLSRVAVGLGLVAMIGATGCAADRDSKYTQLPTPDDARMVDGDPRLVDDHGDVHVHTAHSSDPLANTHDRTGDKAGDLGTSDDDPTAKLRDR